MEQKLFIQIRQDERGLWTADLRTKDRVVATLGGSYPKVYATTLDAKQTWGNQYEVVLSSP